MQRLLPSDSQYQTRSLCRMEMQRSMPSKIKQPDMKTKDKPRNQSKSTTSPERDTCGSRNNRSIYFSLTYSQSPYNHKSLNCYVQKTPRWRVSITEGASDTLQSRYLYRSAFKEHQDDTGRGNCVTNQQVFCTRTSRLQTFTWQLFYFVYFCLAKHLGNIPHSEQDLLAI